jgi:hypothetical protein
MVNFDWGEYDRYLREACGELESYLLSNSQRWPLGSQWGGDIFLPERLTIGHLLLARKIYLAIKPSDVNPDRCIEEIQQKWTSAWEEKVSAEWQERLRLWGDVIKEIRQAEEYPLSYYQNEVRNRVIQELFIIQNPKIHAEFMEHLSAIDHVHSAIFTPGSFIWDQRLESAFDKRVFWYLYGEPKKTSHSH